MNQYDLLDYDNEVEESLQKIPLKFFARPVAGMAQQCSIQTDNSDTSRQIGKQDLFSEIMQLKK